MIPGAVDEGAVHEGGAEVDKVSDVPELVECTILNSAALVGAVSLKIVNLFAYIFALTCVHVYLASRTGSCRHFSYSRMQGVSERT